MVGDDIANIGRSKDMESKRFALPHAEDMRALGAAVAERMRGGEVILLSGPLGAGKTTFAQGFGAGLGIDEPIVSPTFTIARELDGVFADGRTAHLIHVDAYRLGGVDYAPGQDSVDRLLDELESLGLDEELEDVDEHAVVLMEWGEQMTAALADERLDVVLERPVGQLTDGAELTSDGVRYATLTGVGARWAGFLDAFEPRPSAEDEALQHDNALQ